MAWRYEEGSRQIRTRIWLEGRDHVVVLGERRHRDGTQDYLLVTAFYVDSDKMKRVLHRKYLQRVGTTG